jgi:hypothetical protein
MRKLMLLAGAAVIVLGSIGSADAQARYRRGYYGGGWGGGGAVAAGIVGGLVLGGLAAAATAPPAYAYPYGYGYAPPPQPYYGGYYAARPVYRPAYGGYPYYGGGVVYSADPYAAYHEIRGGYRTVYRHGYGRVLLPPY